MFNKIFEESNKSDVVLIIDDIDHLESLEVAREIIEASTQLRDVLGIPLIISIREETISKIQSKPSINTLRRKHTIPPSFKKILQLRLAAFTEAVLQTESVGRTTFTKQDLIIFVSNIINSICERSIYSKLVTFHYDIDMLLDMVQCLISSPFLHPEMILEKCKKGKPIGWNLMLNSFQKYVYLNHYEQNSFFLNIYDNSIDFRTLYEIPEIDYENVLVRSRLLSLLAYKYTHRTDHMGSELPIFPYRSLVEDMERLGYSNECIQRAMSAFAAHRLIRTGRLNNELDENQDNISISTAVIFYLDDLIYEYRYIENVLPVTPVDYEFNWKAIPELNPETKNFGEIDYILLRFSDFIEKCERKEITNGNCDKDFLKEIWPAAPISKRIKNTVQKFKGERFGKPS